MTVHADLKPAPQKRDTRDASKGSATVLFMHQRDAWRLVAVVLIGLIVGLATGSVALCLLLVTGAYVAWLHVKLSRLLRWIRDRKTNEPPNSPGIFEDLSFEFDYLRERHKKRKKKLAKYLRQFQQTIRALPDATVVLDSNDGVQWANDAALHYLGIRWPEDVDKRITNLIHLPVLRDFVARERGRDVTAIEIETQTAPKRYLSVLIAPYEKDQRLLVARDVSQLHRANQIRSDFVANVSHDLRTPITVLRGYLENLVGQREQGPEMWWPAFEQMQSHADRMGTLVEELLLLSKLEQEVRVPNPEVVCVGDLISDIHSRACEISATREHLFSLEIEPDLSIKGARAELYNAFSNLVFNAVKYTAERGVIKIRWYRDDSGAHFEVEDNGIGIAEDQLPRLTERFYRVDASRSRTEGGTGLGLAIVKHVLLRHGAELAISSTLGQGSVFRCDFPESEIAAHFSAAM